MLHILKTEQRQVGNDHMRNWCYCYCDVHKKWGWTRETMIKTGKVTSGIKFPIKPYEECEDLQQFLNQYSWREGDNGYMRTTYKRKNIMQHRLVVESITNEKIPSGLYIDHIDGDKKNNDPSNLRLLFQWENDAYRSSQMERIGDNNLPRGVYKRKEGPHYRAKFRGKNIGNVYKTVEDAFRARVRAERKFYEDNKELVEERDRLNKLLHKDNYHYLQTLQEKHFSMEELNLTEQEQMLVE